MVINVILPSRIAGTFEAVGIPDAEVAPKGIPLQAIQGEPVVDGFIPREAEPEQKGAWPSREIESKRRNAKTARCAYFDDLLCRFATRA
ncbi:MAG: hypothetical protein WCA28_14195 [Bradyrhizobium sp.]